MSGSRQQVVRTTRPQAKASLGVAVAALLALAAGALAQDARQADARQVKELVQKLQADDYKTRDQAQKDLTELGDAARPQLEEALQSKDPELKVRAGAILKVLGQDQFAAGSREIEKNVLWMTPLEKGATAIPLISKGVLYVPSADRKVHALDPKTGKAAWVCEELTEGTSQLWTVRPAKDLLVLIDNDLNMYGLDLQGKKQWMHDWPKQNNQARSFYSGASCEPVVLESEIRFADMRLGIFAYNMATKMRTTLLNEPSQLLLADEKSMLIASSARTSLRFYNTPENTIAWERKDGQVAGFIRGDGVVYYRSGRNVLAAELATGQTLWQQELLAEVPTVTASDAYGQRLAPDSENLRMAIADGVLHILAGQHLIGIDAKTGKMKSQHKLSLAAPPAPANGNIWTNFRPFRGRFLPGNQTMMQNMLSVAGKVAYVGSWDGLRAFDLASGKPLWQLKTAGPIVGLRIEEGVAYCSVGLKEETDPDEELPKGQSIGEFLGVFALKLDTSVKK